MKVEKLTLFTYAKANVKSIFEDIFSAVPQVLRPLVNMNLIRSYQGMVPAMF